MFRLHQCMFLRVAVVAMMIPSFGEEMGWMGWMDKDSSETTVLSFHLMDGPPPYSSSSATASSSSSSSSSTGSSTGRFLGLPRPRLAPPLVSACGCVFLGDLVPLPLGLPRGLFSLGSSDSSTTCLGLRGLPRPRFTGSPPASPPAAADVSAILPWSLISPLSYTVKNSWTSPMLLHLSQYGSMYMFPSLDIALAFTPFSGALLQRML